MKTVLIIITFIPGIFWVLTSTHKCKIITPKKHFHMINTTIWEICGKKCQQFSPTEHPRLPPMLNAYSQTKNYFSSPYHGRKYILYRYLCVFRVPRIDPTGKPLTSAYMQVIMNIMTSEGKQIVQIASTLRNAKSPELIVCECSGDCCK